jgi:hypothetical protein
LCGVVTYAVKSAWSSPSIGILAGHGNRRREIPGMNRIPVPIPVKAIMLKIAGRFPDFKNIARSVMPKGSITVPSASGDQVCRG